MEGTESSSASAAGHIPQLDGQALSHNGRSPFLRSSSAGSSTSINNNSTRHLTSRPQTHSSSSRNTSSSAKAELRNARRDVRTLPPWIDSYEEAEPLTGTKPTDRLLSPPDRSHAPQHNHAPSTPTRRRSQDGYVDEYDDVSSGGLQERQETTFFGVHKQPEKGRKWDHARQGDPVIMQSGVLQNASPWRTYIKSSMYGPAPDEDVERVNEAFLARQTPGYQRPWRGDLEGVHDPEKLSKTMIDKFQHTLVMHPLVPLLFRLIVLITSVIALGISASVHHLSDVYSYPQNPSTTMAIVVDVVALPYILYITWDEYTGKPLGLRASTTKIRLVLLDLFFIIFESANLALAFAALADTDGSCRVGRQSGTNYVICHRVKALCGILMLALMAWSLTFAVSIFRLVKRVGGREGID